MMRIKISAGLGLMLLTTFSFTGIPESIYGTYRQHFVTTNGSVYTSTIVIKKGQTYDETEYSKIPRGITNRKYSGKWVMKGDTLVFSPLRVVLSDGSLLTCDPDLPERKKPMGCLDHRMVYKEGKLWFYNDIHQQLDDSSQAHKKIKP